MSGTIVQNKALDSPSVQHSPKSSNPAPSRPTRVKTRTTSRSASSTAGPRGTCRGTPPPRCRGRRGTPRRRAAGRGRGRRGTCRRAAAPSVLFAMGAMERCLSSDVTVLGGRCRGCSDRARPNPPLTCPCPPLPQPLPSPTCSRNIATGSSRRSTCAKRYPSWCTNGSKTSRARAAAMTHAVRT